MKMASRILLSTFVLGLALSQAPLFAGDFLIKKEDIPKAINMLKNGNPGEKIKAAKDLGDRGAVKYTDVINAIEPLKTLLGNDVNGKVRAAAAEALGKIAPDPGRETVELLLKTLKEDKDEDVKIASMQAISRMGMDAKMAVPELQKYAKDKDNKKLSNAAKQALKNLKK